MLFSPISSDWYIVTKANGIYLNFTISMVKELSLERVSLAKFERPIKFRDLHAFEWNLDLNIPFQWPIVIWARDILVLFITMSYYFICLA